jgi:2-polyprenyl-3-methyl-5-hydroxy-6-metoxy-1,4-benzoquinol methylase
MSYDYDKLYGETRDALGQPTAIFVDFFDQLDQQNVRVLDVGCGQGRDAVFIAQKGHRVVGVDISANGIRDLNDVADKKNLHIEGVVADISTFVPDGSFDVILVDRTLHMLDQPIQIAVLKTLLDHVNAGGWVLIADEKSNIAGFKAAVLAHAVDWRTHVSRAGYLFLQRP